MTRQVNAKALELIKTFEGFRSRWYRDPVGIWTVGYGHTDAAGAPKFASTKDRTFPQAEATAILARDLRKYAAAVERAVRVPLTDDQFGALVSWCYNVGPGAMAESTLIRKLNDGQYSSVPGELKRWTKAKGKTLPGLGKRRAAEAALFSGGSAVPAKPSSAPARPGGGFWAAIARFFRSLVSGGQR